MFVVQKLSLTLFGHKFNKWEFITLLLFFLCSIKLKLLATFQFYACIAIKATSLWLGRSLPISIGIILMALVYIANTCSWQRLFRLRTCHHFFLAWWKILKISCFVFISFVIMFHWWSVIICSVSICVSNCFGSKYKMVRL